MNAVDLFHTGLVVDDVDEAKARLTELAGYHWGPTVGGDTGIVTPEGERTVTMTVAFSVEEPRLELVGAIPGTIWEPPEAGVHHLGYWSDDVDADVEALLTAGLVLEAKAPTPDGPPMWAYCRDPRGARIELVTRAMAPVLTSLFVEP